MGRRSASPRSSGSVRRSSPSPVSRAPPRPQPKAAPTPPPQQQGRQPGLMGQMAATAGGVAIGSAMGHALGNMFGGGRSEEAAPAQATEVAGNEKQQPCEFEWRQFLDCTQTQSDVGMCQSFNDMFKECKSRYGQ